MAVGRVIEHNLGFAEPSLVGYDDNLPNGNEDEQERCDLAKGPIAVLARGGDETVAQLLRLGNNQEAEGYDKSGRHDCPTQTVARGVNSAKEEGEPRGAKDLSAMPLVGRGCTGNDEEHAPGECDAHVKDQPKNPNPEIVLVDLRFMSVSFGRTRSKGGLTSDAFSGTPNRTTTVVAVQLFSA